MVFVYHSDLNHNTNEVEAAIPTRSVSGILLQILGKVLCVLVPRMASCVIDFCIAIAVPTREISRVFIIRFASRYA